MNRHFVNYAALPCAPLGEPIRKQAAKPSPETPWKPMPGHPGYLERINAQGVREVTHKDNMPAPAPAAPALNPGRVMPEDVHGSEPKPEDVPAKWAATEPKQAPAAADVPAAPTEWHDCAPAEAAVSHMDACKAFMDSRLSAQDGNRIKAEFGLHIGGCVYKHTSALHTSQLAAFVARCRKFYREEPQQ